MARVVGIDLGTTYSAVAIADASGTASIVRNREGENITPSVVMFQGDTVVVGSQAKRSAATAPEHVVQFVKRTMGESRPAYIAENGDEYRPEAVSALILKRLKEDAEMMLGEPVDRAVITVPAYFNHAQRKATQDAGRMAGLEVLRVVNEPTAAALAYGIGKADEDEQVGTVLVYDLGGGTFDVTVMRIEDGEYEVIATDGDRQLGGYDWDSALMEYISAAFQAAGGCDIADDGRLLADVREKAEIAKRTLSMAPQAVVTISAGDQHEQIRISREKFEEVTADLLARTESLTEGVLDDANLRWDAVDKVLLVGGSTRMPMVTRMVERLSGKVPEHGVNQDEVVALGAALLALDESERTRQAKYDRARTPRVGSGPAQDTRAEAGSGLARLTKGKVKSIRDVTSQSLGIVVVDNDDHDREYNMVIIERNTPVPCRKQDTVSTLHDKQTKLRAQVTEGDDEDLEYVEVIGESTLILPPYPKGAELEVHYSYDVDGVVHIEVKDLTSGKWLGEFDIERPDNLSRQEIEQMSDRVARAATL